MNVATKAKGMKRLNKTPRNFFLFILFPLCYSTLKSFRLDAINSAYLNGVERCAFLKLSETTHNTHAILYIPRSLGRTTHRTRSLPAACRGVITTYFQPWLLWPGASDKIAFASSSV